MTTDLSAAGCFVVTETPVPENAVVELTLHLADDPEPAKASGRVVRVHRRQDERLGFSVEFDCIDDATCSRIDRLVERALLELSGDPQKP
jgi:c-di-GMP-binding flagellar brake protein YcgR